MKRTISSSMTFIYKIPFPIIWIGGFATGTFGMIYTGGFNEPAPGFLFATISGTAFLYWGCMRLKVVQLDGERLYISNYLKRVEVDPADIEKITECVLMNTNPVWIHFKAPTEFGSKIMFMPKTRWFSFFSSHPIVAELREIAKARGAFPSGT